MRALLLWAFLLVMFVALWTLFSTPQGAPEVARGPGPRSFWPAILWSWLAPLVAFALAWLFLGRGVIGGTRLLQQGLAKMNEGDLEGATALFQKVGRRGWPLAASAFALIGIARLRAGGPRQALDAFGTAYRRSRLGLRVVRVQAAQWMALCHALLGDLEAASQWIAEARRTPREKVYGLRVDEIAEAIALLRRGDAAGAERLLSERWSEIERSTDAVLFRGVRLVRALAAERAGAGGTEALLGGARPFRRGEYLWLAVAWPEMAEFLEANGFAEAA
jgi:hypothetical protein